MVALSADSSPASLPMYRVLSYTSGELTTAVLTIFRCPDGRAGGGVEGTEFPTDADVVDNDLTQGRVVDDDRRCIEQGRHRPPETTRCSNRVQRSH